MKSALLHEQDGTRTFLIVFETGDEAMTTLASFATTERLAGSHFTGIGAFARAVVAYFDWPSKRYRHVAIDEQVEVLSLSGDVTREKAEPKVHAHVVLGKADATAHGGHLIEGHVRPTLELVLVESPRYLVRRSGLRPRTDRASERRRRAVEQRGAHGYCIGRLGRGSAAFGNAAR